MALRQNLLHTLTKVRKTPDLQTCEARLTLAHGSPDAVPAAAELARRTQALVHLKLAVGP